LTILQVRRKDLRKEFIASKAASPASEGTHLIMRKFLVENPSISGRKLSELNLRETSGVTVSRLRRKGRIIIPGGDTVLKLDDVALIVAPQQEMENLHAIFGQETHESLEIDPAVEARQIVVTNPSLHHVMLSAIALHAHYHVNITRIWKSGVEFAPSADHTLELGDTVVAVGRRGNLDKVEKFLGKREKIFADVDFASMCFGIAIGIIIGQISIPIPHLCHFKLGISGGSLLMGLLLGYVRRFGFLTGQMSASAKMILKDFGLSLFIAGIGATAGSRFVHIAPGEIGIIFAASVIILAFSLTAVFLIIYKIMKLDIVQSLAFLCGGFINSLAVTSLTSQVNSEEPSNTFAACYPLSLFVTILAGQILVML
jgi:AspT/YidE/YbjL antiporter-like protein